MPSPKIHQVARKAKSLLGYSTIAPGNRYHGAEGSFSYGSFPHSGVQGNTAPTLRDHNITNAFTVGFWFAPQGATQADVEPYFDLVDTAAATINRIYIFTEGTVAADPMCIQITDSAGATIKDYQYGSQTTVAGTIGYYVFTWDGTTMLFYRDASAVTATTLVTDTTGIMTNTTRGIASMNNVANTVWTANHQHVLQVWNTALTANEIQSVWCNGAGVNFNCNANTEDYVSAANLTHWFRPGVDTTGMQSYARNYARGAASVVWPVATTFLDTVTTYSGNPTLHNSRGNCAGWMEFDGSTEYLRNTTAQIVGISNVFSIAFLGINWASISGSSNRTLLEIAPSVGGSINRIKIGLLGPSTNDPIEVIIADSSGISIKDYEYGWALNRTANTALPQGNNSVIIAWDGPNNVLKMYVNGLDMKPTARVADVNSSARTDTNQTIGIGCDSNGSSRQNMNLNSVAIWNKFITTTEAVTLHNEGFCHEMDLAKNTLGYYGADNLKHWWRLLRRVGSMGTGGATTVDWVKSGGINMDQNSTNLTIADYLMTTGRGLAGSAVRLIGPATNGAAIGTSVAQTLGFANAWTLLWVGALDTIATVQDIVNIGVEASANSIHISSQTTSGRVRVQLYDKNAVLFKDYLYNSLLSAQVMRPISINWDGTTLSLHWLGALTAATTKTIDLTGTMVDTARVVVIGGPTTFTGTTFAISTMCRVLVWNAAIASAELIAIFKIYNGMGFWANQGPYTKAASLVHDWNLGADPYLVGKDHAPLQASPCHLIASSGFGAGQFANESFSSESG